MKPKRIIVLILSLCMAIFALSACNPKSNEGTIPSPSEQTTPNQSDEPTKPTEPDKQEKPSEPSKPDKQETPSDPSDKEEVSVLVAFFSCTNKTKGVAERIAQASDGTLFEITAKQPYTSADLNYNNDNCRANREQHDRSVRPEIAEKVESMEQYDVVFLGYPIWWGEEPRIIDTFLESYDLSGKAIVPFCTSGGSGISTSENNIHNLTPKATWLDGKRFVSTVSQDEVNKWVQSIMGNIKKEEKIMDTIYLTIGSHKISVKLEENVATAALVELLKEGDISYTASDYGGFEKVGSLGHTLPRDDHQTTTEAGDVILYSGNQIVLFYGSNSWSYTKLGKMQGSADEIKEILTKSNPITVKISLQ